LNLGGTFIADGAVRSGDIDLYVEYSGTAHSAIFKSDATTHPDQVFDDVRRRYADGGLTLMDPLGFENTFAILVRGADARALGLRTISDVRAKSRAWRAGFGYEFLQRADGFPGLARTYGLEFATPPTAMDLSLIYRALAERQVDLVAGDATSGLIHAYDLVMLEDDLRYFPPYDAAIVVRTQLALARADVRAALASLAGRISATQMRQMNYAVDVERRDAADVARDFVSTLQPDGLAPESRRGG
jgi:glycine betaine/choline ABC-type transport system substrate-binding protein